MNIYNVIILDESGSMTAIYNQALTGINEVLSGIRKTSEDFPDQQHYVTQSLMSKLEWGRITHDRLDWLNDILMGVEMELETSDVTEAALYRNFLPVGFATWNEFLDSIIIPKCNAPLVGDRA